MIYLDELKDFKLYRRPLVLPRNGNNKSLGGVAMLLTPNIESSISIINSDLIDNRNYVSYYLEKDVSFYLNEQNQLTGVPILENYVHKTVEGKDIGYLIEGVYKMFKEKIIYNGTESDVKYISDIIDITYIDHLNSDLKAPVNYPISITVINKKDREEIINNKGIMMRSRSQFKSDKDYWFYCQEVVYEYLIKCINPKINPVLCDAIVMVLAKTFDEFEDYIKVETGYYPICLYIKKLISEDNGYHKLKKMIIKNETYKIPAKSAKVVIKNFTEEATLIEEGNKLTQIQKLKRSIKYSSRKGSVHIANKVNRMIDRTVDSSVKTPDFTTSDDPNLTDTKPPTITDIKSQIDSAAKGQGSGAHISSDKGNEGEVLHANTEATVLDEDFTWFNEFEEDADCYRVDNNITFFNEANSSSNPALYKILYKERLKNNRMIAPIYDEILKSCPSIKYTFLSYNRYKNKNLILDLHYYNELYFKNSIYKQRRGMELYLQLLDKMLNDPRLKEAGYTGKKCLIIPIQDWDINPKTKMWLYTKDINPVSIIYNLMVHEPEKLKKVFGDMSVVFYAPNGYFKVNFAKADINKNKQRFIPYISKLRSGEVIEDIDGNIDSKAVIVDTIVDNIENSKNVKIHHLVGDADKQKRIPSEKESIISLDNNDRVDGKKITAKSTDDPKKKQSDIAKDINGEINKADIIDKIEKAADGSNSVEDTLTKLDEDEQFKQMIAALDSESNNAIKINNSRMNRMNILDEKILEKEVKGKKVKDILEKKEGYMNTPLEPANLPIESINSEWNNLTYGNFAHQYSIDDDIVAMLYDLKNKTYPISILDIITEDTSTSEDYVNTYTVKMEDYNGKRFSIKFDIPIMVNDQYMMLRGNKKVISIQSLLMPIVKTDPNVVQVISNYNKIIINRFGENTIGKSNEVTDRIIKTLKKNKFNNINVNWVACDSNLVGYDLPIDFLDFASCMTSIDTDKFFITFDIKSLLEKFKGKIDLSKGIPYGYYKNDKSILYFTDNGDFTLCRRIYGDLSYIKEFIEAYGKTTASTKYVYSKASILNTEIPLIVVAAYSEGLTSVLNKAYITYDFVEKLPKNFKKESTSHNFIKFSDGYLIYENSYGASLLLNGLKECNTEMYSIMDVNNKTTYLEFLDNFGGRLKSDGIDNFYDCMIDPITKDILTHYKMPTDYIEVLVYANNLLADNKYFKHPDQSCRRFRKNEVIAGYTYKALAKAYGEYASQIRHGRNTTMSIKQSAVIDSILLDPTSADLSIINCLNEKESYDQVTTKGLSGMNNDRSYSLNKRGYDDSMVNVLSMSTGFAATVGINRQATINANVDTARGFIKPPNGDLNSVNTMCMSEALTPMGTTRDDPFRSAMTFIQTTRHGMKVKHADPLLVTNGSDEALPYLISDTFAHKAKDKGEVVELVENDYMIVKYADGSSEFINLKDNIEKNSSSGFYVDVKLSTKLKNGSKFKKGDIIAYDKESLNDSVGLNDNPAYVIGTLAKVALMDTDEGFEDSAIVSQDLSEAMTSIIYKKKEVNLNKNASIFNLVQPGTPVEEGDTLLTMQSAFDEDDANVLLKKLSGTEEEISQLGRINIKSSVTGWVQDIEIARTVEMDELSPSLQKLCKKYESDVKRRKNAAKSQGVKDTYKIGVEGKLDATGRLKDAPDGIKITIYLAYEDKFSIGDKLVYWSANKGVCKDIFPAGLEPYSLDRPDEKIHTLVSIASINGRMVTSIQNIGVINRLLIEASRKAKDILGIEYPLNLFDDNKK